MLKILVENRTLSALMPVSKVNEVQLLSFQNGVHPAFDVFDRTDPDAFVCHASIVDKTVIKNLKERPLVKIVVVHDSKIGVKMLRDEIGDVFDVVLDVPICELDSCIQASSDQSLETEVFCPEGTIFAPTISHWNFSKAKIFSTIGFVDHLSFCGVLPPAKRFDGYKSCRYALVEDKESPNAVMCGAIPIYNDSLAPSTSLTKDGVLEGLTNYDFSSNVMRILGKQKEADQLIAMKNWIGANN